MSRHARAWIGGGSALLLLIIDQASKVWATASLPPGRELTVVPGLLWFRLLTNTGATFSLLRGYNLLFGIATVLVLFAVGVILLRGYAASLPSVIGLGAVAGGAMGNLVDRVRLGGVVDFILVPIWPADFNLADLGVRLGVALFLTGLLLDRRRSRRRR
ncbi:MAG: signal peptidase II [Candidatus Dormibacteraeota bacterium]|nr:signal peptidase II [Candidatus Dormibacteraeota bacterium]